MVTTKSDPIRSVYIPTLGGDALTLTSSLTGEIISHHRGAARAVHPSLDHHAGRAPFVVAGHQGLPLGVYTVASAYRCQFQGSAAPFRSAKFW